MFQPHSEVNELFEDYLRGRDLGAARQNNKYLAMYLAYLNNCTLQVLSKHHVAKVVFIFVFLLEWGLLFAKTALQLNKMVAN